MNLSGTDARILAIVELEADCPGAEIARRAGTNIASVYRTIERFIDREIIVGKTAVIDPAKVGLIEFGVNVALAPQDDGTIARLLRRMQANAQVSWIAEVGGELDLMCNLIAESPHRAKAIIEELFGDFSASILRRRVCSRSARLRYPRWFLGARRVVQPTFSSGETLEHLGLDDTDRAILDALSRMEFESFRDLARATDVPLATFLRRVQSLRQWKILLGFGYRFDLSKLEVQQFRILLSFRAPNQDLRAKLRKIAGQERTIKLLVECLGDWDYELEVDQPPGQDVKRLTNLLHREFHGELMQLSLIPIFRHVRYISFPTALRSARKRAEPSAG